MPPLDIDTLEKRFKLIQEVYSRIGTEAHPQKGKIASAISNIGSIFRSAKSPGPLPDKIHYTALKQAGRPFIQPKSFLTAQVKTSYLNQLKNEIAKARGVSKEDALPIAEQTLGPLCKAAESGSLNDWLAYYQAFDNAGLKSDLPKDKIPSLSFWSGKSANNVNASEMAKQFSDSGVGARDIDQVAFNSTKAASGAFAPLSKTNQANFDHIWYELFGLQSSLYATLARGDVICFMPMGLSIGNIFWKNELPVLRRLQQMGAVDHVYVYTDDKTPTGFKDDDKDEDMRRQLWFNKSVELTSASVSMSKRQGDGTWLKLGVNADIFVKWLLGAPESSRPVLYRYRQLALIYARLLQGNKNDEFIVEMWKPYVSDDVKRLIVRGYQTDKDVLHRVSILEKFLFANFPDWSRLPLWPDHLLYVEDCILHAKGARNVLLALLHDGTWIYAEHIAKRIEELPESTVKALLEGKPNETPTELSFRLASLHSAIAGQDIQQTVGITGGRVAALRQRFGG